MAVQLTKEFWTNLVLFVVACVALGLSIWALNVRCKKDGFGSCIDGQFAACGTNVTPSNWNCCPNPDGTPRKCKPAFGSGEYACQ